MQRAIMLSLALAVTPMVAGAQSNPPAAPLATTLPTTTSPANAGKLAPTDDTFVTNAAQGGLAEVQAGQLAEQRGDATVKTIGHMMVTDHTKANSQLAGIAKSQGLTIPNQPDPAHIATLAQLRGAKGETFDNQYLEGQLTDHQKTIALFQQEAEQGTDPQLKSFAQTTLPVLQHHLAAVKQALQKSPSGSATKTQS
jgi:putative membrane protein